MPQLDSQPINRSTEEGIEILWTRDGKFQFVIDEMDNVHEYDTLALANTGAHEFVIAQRAKVNLDIDVLLPTGETIKIRRLSNSNDGWLTTPKGPFDLSHIYWPSDSTKEILAEVERLEAEAATLKRSIFPRSMALKKPYFSRNYGDAAEEIKKGHDQFLADYASRSHKEPHPFNQAYMPTKGPRQQPEIVEGECVCGLGFQDSIHALKVTYQEESEASE